MKTKSIVFLLCCFTILFSMPRPALADVLLTPEIVGPWWKIAGNPDLGEYNNPKQKVLDFGVWQADDGAWQLWACIYNANVGGKLRLLHGWEGDQLTDAYWAPQGVKMLAEPELGETPGAVMAPHVYIEGGWYYMTYGCWTHICMATSDDGKTFSKQVRPDGTTGMFGEAGSNPVPRDSHVIKIGNKYYCYYCADPDNKGAIFCRMSYNLSDWGPSTIVNAGGVLGSGQSSAQCPFVLWHPSAQKYYLFRSDGGEQTGVYASENPLDFGVYDDSKLVTILPIKAPEIVLYEGQYYVAELLNDRNGIQMARMNWVPEPATWALLALGGMTVLASATRRKMKTRSVSIYSD